MKLSNVIRLGYRYKWLLTYCFAAVVFFRLALFLSTYRKIARHIELRPTPVAEPRSPYVVAWAVRNVSCLVPFAHCLTQSLTTQYILARQGLTSVVRVGVKQKEGTFKAHAWVLFDDIVILGGTDYTLSEYAVMTDLKPKIQ